jgi:hypothetical protein
MRQGPIGWLLFLLASGCGAAPVFRDQPPVWHVNDTEDIPEPEEREFHPKVYFANIFVVDALDRALELRDEEAAWNTNSLDEVPNSSWFENRIGIRRISPPEAARGTKSEGPPRPPFTVVRGKVGGGNPGFVMKDGTQRTFIVKFDTLENPEMQTAASVIVNRIFWTLGYNVPSDQLFSFRREELAIDPKATYEDTLKNKKPLTSALIDDVLRSSPRRPDGAYRAIASEYLSGKPKGGFPAEGVRKDDANDRVPHEHRRELRGLRVLAAWVGHTDVKEDNTLDMYVEEGGRRFLRHYLLDFGEALDGHAAEYGRREDGWEHYWDWEAQGKATLALGLWKRPWEDARPTRWAAVGAFSSRSFDPERWREAYPYWPFAEADRADCYWAAKLVMRFDEPMLRAIVAEGKYSEPGAAAYVVKTLVERRNAIGRAYLESTSPLDELEAGPSGLCMTDLGIRYRLATHGIVERIHGGHVVERRTVATNGRVCMALPRHDDYTSYRLRVRRGNDVRPPIEIHLKGGARPRILGVIRSDE